MFLATESVRRIRTQPLCCFASSQIQFFFPSFHYNLWRSDLMCSMIEMYACVCTVFWKYISQWVVHGIPVVMLKASRIYPTFFSQLHSSIFVKYNCSAPGRRKRMYVLNESDLLFCLLTFNSLSQLLQLIAKSQLTSLSGAAQKNYFNILDKIVRKGKLRLS